jgi:SAM-dependent methyltransferase
MIASLGTRYLNFYKNKKLLNAYPAEYLVRIFLGSYPLLKLNREAFSHQRLLEVGCGDGRNLILFSRLGFETHGTEIDDGISQIVRENVEEIGIAAAIKTGWNIELSYENEFFDYLVSWNSSYYMGDVEKYHSWESYVEEFARVIRPKGSLILSIPQSDGFIYRDSQELKPGYHLIANDPYQIRNGQVFRYFSSEHEIVESLTPVFTNFRLARIDDDCFGQINKWHIIVCDKK